MLSAYQHRFSWEPVPNLQDYITQMYFQNPKFFPLPVHTHLYIHLQFVLLCSTVSFGVVYSSISIQYMNTSGCHMNSTSHHKFIM